MNKCNKDIIAKYSDCGSGGKQIVVLKHNQGAHYWNGKAISYNILKENFNNWLFQEKLFNVSKIGEVHKSSLNTFRVMTYLNYGEPCVLYAMLKFGNNNAETDNAHTNGVYVKVNLESGCTEGLAYNENLEVFDKHPLTNVELANIKIPNFDSVIKIAKRCALLFPTLRFVGWDIALTDKGPVVLEGNSSPGLTIIQRTHSGMEDFLKIYDNK